MNESGPRSRVFVESDRRQIERAMHKDVLDMDKYPEITYTSTEVTGAAPGEWAVHSAPEQ